MEKVLVLFSGGKDSILATCKLIEQGYITYLVNYNNSCSIDIEKNVDGKIVGSVDNAADELIRVYGSDNVKFLGTKLIVGTWRRFFLPYFNMKPNDIIKQFGQLPHSQFNCLTCRSTMYLYSIALCKELGINNIAEGARTSQQFVIELKPMLDKYCELLQQYDIKLLLPVLDMVDDFERGNQLMIRNIQLGQFESKCLLGTPIDKNYPIDEEVIEAVTSFYDREIKPKSNEIVNDIKIKIKVNTPYSNEKRFY